jgi:hypothetical protein
MRFGAVCAIEIDAVDLPPEAPPTGTRPESSRADIRLVFRQRRRET